MMFINKTFRVLIAGTILLLAAWSSPENDPRESLRQAVDDLCLTFGKDYPRGEEYLKRLETLPSGKAGEKALQTLHREALFDNPLIRDREILFVVRAQYQKDHHNTATLFQTGEINASKFEGGGWMGTLRLSGGKVHLRTILESSEGVIRDPEVHFEGKKILFSMRRHAKEDYHIYEIGVDGKGLRPLTSAPGVADIDPLYLPDGAIVFTSTREPKYCMCNRHIMGNLFRMEGDGANIHQIADSTLFEGHGALLSDGRIMYDRWEYVDRNFGDAQGLWAVNPDGTNPVLVYGNNTPSPGGVIDARPVPGTNLIACIFVACHDRPWGAMALLDTSRGMEGLDPVVQTWPPEARNLVKDAGTANRAWDLIKKIPLRYEDPWPLVDGKGRGAGKYFLVSRTTGNKEESGLFLVDVFGNEVLLHKEGRCVADPMPLEPNPRPLSLPVRRTYDDSPGTFYVHDVYKGTHMKGVERGSVKYLRVVESPEKRFWTQPNWKGQGTIAPAMNWHDFNNKRILGTVPVEEDGSAYFSLPAGRFVFFQLLDERGMMVQSMRSGTEVQPGERGSCIGCHESRMESTVAVAYSGLAAKRDPSPLEGWYGPPRLFNYLTEVQPVFDRHCVGCHDFGKDAGKKLVLARDKNLVFNASYSDLWRKNLTGAVGAGPAEILPARSWGSSRSRLVKQILSGHNDVKLDAESFDRIVTWIDINAPYYPSYASAYPDNQYGRSPLTKKEQGELKKLGVDLAKQPAAHLVSFDRPEMSPCLDGKKGTAREKILAILRIGAERLREQPRAEQEGFVPCEVDRKREEKYQERLQVEVRNRKAIHERRKVYDPGIEP